MQRLTSGCPTADAARARRFFINGCALTFPFRNIFAGFSTKNSPKLLRFDMLSFIM
ncbi:MAG TPA: hypothetical protein IAA71_02175 [Candidatus Pullichristensenella stercoripullorum]|nr:hypothetical protein [Candidatus Pullichristensenella stercoripullorum]